MEKLTVITIVLLSSSSFSKIPLPVIKSVTHFYGNATVISAFLCNRIDSALLLKHFATNNHQVNVIPLNSESLGHPVPPNHVLFLIDLQCPNATQLLTNAESAKLFSTPFKWLAYHNDGIDKIAEDYFNGIDILVDSDLAVATLKDSTVTLTKLFKRHLEDVLVNFEEIAEWSEETGHAYLTNENVMNKRRRDLMGTALKTCIVITNNDSLNHLTDKRDVHIDSIAKVNYVLVEHLSNIVNATLNYSIQATWGYRVNSSEWSGMIGELTRQEADIGGTALFLTSDRIAIIDYIAMTTPTRSKFIFREPKLSYVANVYTLPFRKSVWLSTAALVIITSLVLYLVIKWEWKQTKWLSLESSTSQKIHDSWMEVALISFGAMCQQGTSAVPYSYPGRITLMFLFTSLMFLYTSYSANIVALLQSSSNSIQTLKDILTSRLDVGVDDTVFNHFYFPNASEPIRRAIYLEKVAPPGQKQKFYKIQEGIKKLRAGLFAFHVETGPGYKLIGETFREDEKCGLKEIQYLQVPDPWLAIQKNSSYRKILKIGLHQLQENGIQSREVGLIYTKKPQCLTRGSSFISVGLVDCYPAAVVLAGGLSASLIILILEIYIASRLEKIAKWRKSKNKNESLPRHGVYQFTH